MNGYYYVFNMNDIIELISFMIGARPVFRVKPANMMLVDRVLLKLLKDNCDPQTGRVKISKEYAASEMGVDPLTVYRSIKRLSQEEHVHWEPSPGRGGWNVTVLPSSAEQSRTGS